jgi:hypothetical protein
VTLELAGIESEIIERARAGAASGRPVAELTLRAMRQCDAAIILVSEEDCGNAQTDNSPDKAGSDGSLKEDVLVEIGAAFVCYDRRVVLLWDEKVPVPLNLQSLSRCRFAGGRLSWDTGVELMKAIKALRD